MAQKQPRRRRRLKQWLPYLGLMLGLCIIGFYPAMELYHSYQRQKVIDQIEQVTVAETHDGSKDMILQQARAYNQRLAGLPTELPADTIWPYKQQLNPKGHHTAFAYVIIPKIALQMPIFHGTDEAVLSAGVGHLDDTSLPVGGASTHCVVSAHSGMSEMRAFDDIRNLKRGDVFAIKTLGTLYAYKIYSIEVVWPHQVESLGIRQGRDLCTLVTCTPYGVNDHRLLVHGERCPVPKDFFKDKPSVKDVLTNRRVLPFVIAFVVVLLLLLSQGRRRRRLSQTRKPSA